MNENKKLIDINQDLDQLENIVDLLEKEVDNLKKEKNIQENLFKNLINKYQLINDKNN